MQQIIDIIEDIPGAEFVKPSPSGQIWGFDDPQVAIDFAFAHQDTVAPYNWVWRYNNVPASAPALGDAEFSVDTERLTIRIKR